MGIARVTVVGSIAGQMTNNVLHFHTENITDVKLADLAVRVQNAFVINPFSLNCSAHQSWSRIHVWEVGSDRVPIDLSFAVQGTWDASLDFTPTVCAVFQLKTSTMGRSGRGRFYMGGFGSRQKQVGLWAPAIQIQLNSCAEAIENFWCDVNHPSYSGNGWVLVVARRENPLPDPLQVVQVLARPMIGTLRRRQLGVGA